MRLTVLGSGTTIPHPKRSSSSYWLETSGGTILLDCSATAIRRSVDEGFDWTGLDTIWISHFHLDHVGGLAPFLAGTKHSEEMKHREKPLRIYGPQGVRGLLERFNGVNNYKLFEQPFPLEVIEVEPLEKFEIVEGVTAVAMSTPHTEESCAIHIRDADDSTLVYTADTGFTEILATFARKVDLFVIEASFPKDKPAQKHLEFAEAMFLIRKADPKCAVLTHLYPEWDAVDFDKEVKRFEPKCEVIEAEDGLRLTVSK
jgi:ribonuclease BN (tRNA processing enzyme)